MASIFDYDVIKEVICMNSMNATATGDFIRKLRKEISLTQKELAEKLNCTDKAVSRWETGVSHS